MAQVGACLGGTRGDVSYIQRTREARCQRPDAGCTHLRDGAGVAPYGPFVLPLRVQWDPSLLGIAGVIWNVDQIVRMHLIPPDGVRAADDEREELHAARAWLGEPGESRGMRASGSLTMHSSHIPVGHIPSDAAVWALAAP